MDWTALVLVSIPLAGAALYIVFHLLKQMCKTPGYTQIVTPASSQIQICEQGGGESVGRVLGQGWQARKGTAENGGWYPQHQHQQQQQRKQQQQEERRERRRRPTFVKLLRPLPVKPVCTSDQLKVKTRQTIHTSKELMPHGQNIPQLREGEQQQGEEEDDEAQDLCPVCQLPLPECRQENRTSSFPQGSWSGREQLQSSGRAHLPPSCPHCDRYENHPCNHHLLPLLSTSAAFNEQVICPDCWPLVRPYLMQFAILFCPSGLGAGEHVTCGN